MSYIQPLTAEYHQYLKDESRTIGSAQTISFPTCEGEVVEILRKLTADGETITIQGARTGVAAGAVPKTGHVMNLSKMKGITGCTQHGKGFQFTVEPGLSLLELNKQLATKKMDSTRWSASFMEAFHRFLDGVPQFYPPDPTESTCSLGGMVSCNASGARSYLYGSVRNHISGLRVVLWDGEILDLTRGQVYAQGRTLKLTTENSKVIYLDLPTYQMPQAKNASGYYVTDDMDAVDLFIGADGTLGIVTQITILTSPLPREIWGTSCFFQTQDRALDFVESLRGSLENIAALEYFDPFALDILRAQREQGTTFQQLPGIPADHCHCVYCEIHCATKEAAQSTLFALGDAIQAVGGNPSDTWVARNDSDLKTLQFFRHAVPECTNMIIDNRKKTESVITKLGSDMSVPDGCLKQVFHLYKSTLQAENLEHAIWGHIGNNHLHVNILPRNAEEFHKGEELFKLWAEETSRMGGAVSAEHGVGKLKSSFLTYMYGSSGIREMVALKSALDPHHTLNLGNLFPSQQEVQP
ncbi:MAG: FAD-binding oxidoreductase [Eubacteriales bacterium]